MNEYWNTCICI